MRVDENDPAFLIRLKPSARSYLRAAAKHNRRGRLENRRGQSTRAVAAEWCVATAAHDHQLPLLRTLVVRSYHRRRRRANSRRSRRREQLKGTRRSSTGPHQRPARRRPRCRPAGGLTNVDQVRIDYGSKRPGRLEATAASNDPTSETGPIPRRLDGTEGRRRGRLLSRTRKPESEM